MKFNVARLADKYGIERLGFLTLTFADHVTDAKEASKRFNSLNTHVLRGRYAETISVIERQKSGRIHFHCLVVLPGDIRTGFNFEECEKGQYSSANKALRAEWAFWRSTARRYRFGRTELLPVKSNAEAIACYVGKYIAKHIDSREERDKGVRLVRYSRGAAAATARFAWNSPGSDNFRRKLRWLCEGIGCSPQNYRAVFRLHFGEKWFWRILGPLFQVRFNWYPSVDHFRNDWPEYFEAFEGKGTCLMVVRVEGLGEDDEKRSVEILKGGDADARQRACVEMLTEDLEQQRARAAEECKRHYPKFQEFVSTARSWLAHSSPEEYERAMACSS